MDATTTATITPTAIDAALLRLIWLASPALPVGGFSYSEGLEAAVEAGRVRDEASAGDWLLDQLDLAVARSDLAVVAQAVQAARLHDEEALARLDAWVRQTRETSELRQQSEQMGKSLSDWAKAVGWGEDGSPPAAEGGGVRSAHHRPAGTPGVTRTYPVAFAVAASSTTAPTRHIALAYAFAWAENMMQAAIKSVPLGQSAGQRILGRLADAIPAAVDLAVALPESGRQAFSPMLAILSAQHEIQYSRLFRS